MGNESESERPVWWLLGAVLAVGALMFWSTAFGSG